MVPESIRLGADRIDVTRELAVSDPFSWPAVLGPLLRREDLSEQQAGAAMGSVLAGEATPAQIAAFATGLRIKGETAAEVTGLVKAMLAAAAPLAGARAAARYLRHRRGQARHVQRLQPGGVGRGPAQVQPVVKHGNRAVSSRSGSCRRPPRNRGRLE